MSTATPPPRLAALRLSPLKSAGSVAVEHARLDPTGLEGDRSYGWVDASGRVLSQKRHPRLAQIRVEPAPGGGFFASVDGATARLPPGQAGAGEVIDARVFSRTVHAERVDDADALHRAVSALLGEPVQLVRFAAREPGSDAPTLQDAYPVSVIGAATLAAAEATTGHRFDLDEVRIGLCLDGVPAFAEDQLEHLVIGSARLQRIGPITRCRMIGIDQRDGGDRRARWQALQAWRGPRPTLGCAFRVVVPGELRVGDAVTLPEAGGGQPR